MIKANELRLDNWVFELGVDYIHEHPVPDHEDKTPVMVDLIVMNNIINHDGTTRMPCYDPIPITPEILEKAGFVKDIDQSLMPVAVHYTFSFKIKGENRHELVSLYDLLKQEPNVNYCVNDFWASNNIKYLHQLQNLYFALTGTELEINLP